MRRFERLDRLNVSPSRVCGRNPHLSAFLTGNGNSVLSPRLLRPGILNLPFVPKKIPAVGIPFIVFSMKKGSRNGCSTVHGDP
jgi:hypothetical protein